MGKKKINSCFQITPEIIGLFVLDSFILISLLNENHIISKTK